MNDKIKLLAEQAEHYASHSGSDLPYNLAFQEKFAELIVQECIDIVGSGGEFASRPKLVEKLQEHFGVE